MTPRWRMLAAVDSSRCASETVQHALTLAAVLSADLDLLYVEDPSLSMGIEATVWPSNAWGEGSCNPHIHRHVPHGTTAPTIAAHAEAIDADVVFLSSRSYSTWRFWRTSVTKDVLRITLRPVCITSAKATDEDFRVRNRRILCVVGLDGRETALVRYAQDVAERTLADLVLLHVVPEPSEGLLHYAVEGGTRPLLRERAVQQVDDLVCGLQLRATTSIMVGDPGKCIPRAAREHSVDLVLVSRARGGSPGVYSSHLEYVLPKLRCPLLTVPVDARAAVRPITDARRNVLPRASESATMSALRSHLEAASTFVI